MEKETCTKPVAKNYNKPAYVVFIAAGIYFFAVKNYSQGFTFFGLALIFDPFNIEKPLVKRPFYQRAWLIIHLLLTLGLLLLMLLNK